MGGAWSIAGIGPSLAQILMERAGMVWACEVTALLLVVSGVMGYGIRPPEGPAPRLHQPGRDLVLAAEDLQTARELAPRLKRVVPGIRLSGGARHDQARAASPQEAVANGADLLVIGRAVTKADDPAAAAAAIAAAV